MTQQFYFWVYTEGSWKCGLERMSVHPRSSQRDSHQPEGGSDPSVHRRMNEWTKCVVIHTMEYCLVIKQNEALMKLENIRWKKSDTKGHICVLGHGPYISELTIYTELSSLLESLWFTYLLLLSCFPLLPPLWLILMLLKAHVITLGLPK